MCRELDQHSLSKKVPRLFGTSLGLVLKNFCDVTTSTATATAAAATTAAATTTLIVTMYPFLY